ncbi:MAG: hypothetical protein KA327_11735 [Pseudarcicella sp.]|nr:hypothetical protein [Pseudarcicella sp.]
MKQRLSAHIEIWGYLNAAIALFFLVGFFTEIQTYESGLIYEYDLLIISIFFGVLSLFQIISRIVEFDNENIYQSLFKGEEIIPLRNILEVKITSTRINRTSLWKLKYIEKGGGEDYFRFLPNFFDNGFEDFKKAVLKQNPSCKFINWTHSLDFDQ